MNSKTDVDLKGPFKEVRLALVTPARNEAQFIELTIKSVIAQTVRPVKWIIVSDGSTDGTDDIVKKYASDHPWIELLRMPERRERHFAGKVNAFDAGYSRVQSLDYDVIGCMDGDISFDEGYFQFLLGRFAENPSLGLAGAALVEGNSQKLFYDYRFVGVEHVSGICQLFRRQCFAEIGGYVPVKGGGIDKIAVIAARFKGWETRTFTEKVCRHQRKMGTAAYGILHVSFKYGTKDYAFGNDPIWEAFRVIYQMTKRPYLIGGVALGMGYLWSMIRRPERPITNEMVKFHRREQMHRLKRFLRPTKPLLGGILANVGKSEG